MAVSVGSSSSCVGSAPAVFGPGRQDQITDERDFFELEGTIFDNGKEIGPTTVKVRLLASTNQSEFNNRGAGILQGASSFNRNAGAAGGSSSLNWRAKAVDVVHPTSATASAAASTTACPAAAAPARSVAHRVFKNEVDENEVGVQRPPSKKDNKEGWNKKQVVVYSGPSAGAASASAAAAVVPVLKAAPAAHPGAVQRSLVASLTPQQITTCLQQTKKAVEVMTIWLQHGKTFSEINFVYGFQRFETLQGGKKNNQLHFNNLRAMMSASMDKLNLLTPRNIGTIITCFDRIHCNQKLLKVFEKDVVALNKLASLHTVTLLNIVETYVQPQLGTNEFVKLLGTELLESHEVDLQSIALISQVYSKRKMKVEFEALQKMLVDDSEAIVEKGSLADIAKYVHSLVMSGQAGHAERMDVIAKALLQEKEVGGSKLAASVKEKDAGASIAQLLHAFAKLGAGSGPFYDAIEQVLTDELLGTIDLQNLVSLAWSLACAGRLEIKAMLTMLTFVVEKHKAGEAIPDETFEQLCWIKLSLAVETKIDFEWEALGDAITAYKAAQRQGAESVVGKAGFKTQNEVFVALQAEFGKSHVHQEHPLYSLDVDLFIDNKGEQGAVVEVLGPRHFVDGKKCKVMNAQTAWRLRMIEAIVGKGNLFPVTTRDWDLQKAAVVVTSIRDALTDTKDEL